MLFKLGSRISQFLHPFHSIAKSLAVIAELYELELAERKPAIRRVTEAPSRSDTTVMYTGREDEREDPFAPEDDEWEGSLS
ncbi:MAG TPA: hypothetical protein VNH83_18080 [Bryobacteraceae bacterium]|nr:hypothetical protein [Bryobacteraceae bacterium]